MVETIYSLVLVVVPRKGFISWINSLISTLEITLPEGVTPESADLYMNSPLFMIPYCKDLAAYEQYIKDHYQSIAKSSFSMWCQDTRYWPKEFTEHMSFEKFREFFDMELHSRFYHLPVKKKD